MYEQSQAVFRALKIKGQIVLWAKNQNTSVLEPSGSAPRMAMQPTDALQEHIRRAQIRDQKI
jgi:hypothetical protein